MTQIEFCNDEYVRSHQKQPKGFGSWMFALTGGERPDYNNMSLWLTAPTSTLTDAKKWIKAEVKKMMTDGRLPSDCEEVDAWILP